MDTLKNEIDCVKKNFMMLRIISQFKGLEFSIVKKIPKIWRFVLISKWKNY